MTKLMDDERIKKFTPLEFKNLPRYDNGDLHVDFWNEDFIWLTDRQKNRISGDDQTRLDDYEEELAYLMEELDEMEDF
tara:strand:- start:257 stop:490 length:234 start_codon:yes stop_codon:yes gene_type:complete